MTWIIFQTFHILTYKLFRSTILLYIIRKGMYNLE